MVRYNGTHPIFPDYLVKLLMMKIPLIRRIPFLANRIPSASALQAHGQIKYLVAWYLSRRKNYLLDHAIPWITYDATRFLKTRLTTHLNVFEYGCGGSTFFWLRYDAHCVSIEHDPDWFSLVKERLLILHATVDLRLVLPDSPPLEHFSHDPDAPNGYRSDWVAFSGETFTNYVGQIDNFPDYHFDIVLVDGHARPSCIAHSIQKIKPGGMLILDNSDVPVFQPAIDLYLRSFERYSFRGLAPIDGAISQTDIFIIRPDAEKQV